MKIFFNIKNPYYKGILPQVGDIIRLYNNTYILTGIIETNIFEMKDMCKGDIKTYSLLRRPFEILLSNSCKNDISASSLIIKKDSIITNYLEQIKTEEELIKNDTDISNNSSVYSYCSIM
jgi:hypothetical protein